MGSLCRVNTSYNLQREESTHHETPSRLQISSQASFPLTAAFTLWEPVPRTTTRSICGNVASTKYVTFTAELLLFKPIWFLSSNTHMDCDTSSTLPLCFSTTTSSYAITATSCQHIAFGDIQRSSLIQCFTTLCVCSRHAFIVRTSCLNISNKFNLKWVSGTKVSKCYGCDSKIENPPLTALS